MQASDVKLYPQVFLAGQRQKLNFEISCADIDPDLLAVRIVPMEQETIPHTDFHIHEVYRYPMVKLENQGNGLFTTDYDFTGEQRYSVTLYYNEKPVAWLFVYSVEEDLSKLNCYKGDTHLHTNCSDGEGTPYEVVCAYRAIGCDFIVITDHHKYWPSIQARDEVSAVTKEFTVLPGEEIHNMNMGYFHLVNIGASKSINEIIETDDAYVQAQVDKILKERDLSGMSCPRRVAYRIFVANEIRKHGGVAVLPHPFWNIGEYQTSPEEMMYHFRNNDYDVLEVLASCDNEDNGSDLQELLRAELLYEGCKVPVCGASDAHQALTRRRASELFGIQFTLVFAKSPEEIPEALKDERGVAVRKREDRFYHTVGRYRYAKYARFLMREFYPEYIKLTEVHSSAMAAKDTKAIKDAEAAIKEFKTKFFAF